MAKRNMRKWLSDYVLETKKKALPILTFPSITPLGITVREMIANSDKQSEGMVWIANHTDCAASVSFMDLSVEAECFGASVRFTDREVPTVIGRIINSEEDADNLKVPEVGAGRTGIYLDTIRKATKSITDRPVFAGMIGPFSLAARLFEVSEIMMDCFDEPDMVHTVLQKATDFLIAYAKEYKEAGADGILLAEPVSGLLSPAMEAEFSAPYVKQIVEAVQEDSFLLIYHNCGNNTPLMVPSLVSNGAAAYHFGNAVSMVDLLEKMPADIPVMGNIDPAGQFYLGTPESIREATLELLEKASKYPNFIISSGCDIPPVASWENIDSFFRAVEDFYENRK